MKVISKKQVSAMKYMKYMQMEKQIQSQVKHPFILGMQQSFQDPRNLYILTNF